MKLLLSWCTELSHWKRGEGMKLEGKEVNNVMEEGWKQWRQWGRKEMGGIPGLVRLNPKQKTSYLHMKSYWHDYTHKHTHMYTSVFLSYSTVSGTGMTSQTCSQIISNSFWSFRMQDHNTALHHFSQPWPFMKTWFEYTWLFIPVCPGFRKTFKSFRIKTYPDLYESSVYSCFHSIKYILVTSLSTENPGPIFDSDFSD